MHQPAPRTPPGNARQQKRTEYRLLFVQQPLKIKNLINQNTLHGGAALKAK